MSDTIVADVLDKIYDLFAANSTLATLVAAQRLRIFDGPSDIDWASESMLVVGGRPIVDDTDSPTEVVWEWATLGVDGTHAEIDETITVPCGIGSMRGINTTNSTMRDVRRTAIGIYAASASALRGSTLTLGQVMWCTANVSSIRQLQSTAGPECLIDFTAFIRTRI
jgi:hypothetical protein